MGWSVTITVPALSPPSASSFHCRTYGPAPELLDALDVELADVADELEDDELEDDELEDDAELDPPVELPVVLVELVIEPDDDDPACPELAMLEPAPVPHADTVTPNAASADVHAHARIACPFRMAGRCYG
jgi:hypothetical protein